MGPPPLPAPSLQEPSEAGSLTERQKWDRQDNARQTRGQGPGGGSPAAAQRTVGQGPDAGMRALTGLPGRPEALLFRCGPRAPPTPPPPAEEAPQAPPPGGPGQGGRSAQPAAPRLCPVPRAVHGARPGKSWGGQVQGAAGGREGLFPPEETGALQQEGLWEDQRPRERPCGRAPAAAFAWAACGLRSPCPPRSVFRETG